MRRLWKEKERGLGEEVVEDRGEGMGIGSGRGRDMGRERENGIEREVGTEDMRKERKRDGDGKNRWIRGKKETRERKREKIAERKGKTKYGRWKKREKVDQTEGRKVDWRRREGGKEGKKDEVRRKGREASRKKTYFIEQRKRDRIGETF